MKLTRIYTEKNLKAGQYIRCVINCHGRHWIEYVDVCGKPYYEKNKKYKYIGKRIKVKGRYQDYSYIGDLGVRGVPSNKFPTVLVKFSNKAWNYLNSIKDVREFAQVLSGVSISDKEYFMKLRDWAWQKAEDDAMLKSLWPDYND